MSFTWLPLTRHISVHKMHSNWCYTMAQDKNYTFTSLYSLTDFIVYYTASLLQHAYRVYSNRTQAKKIITILTFARFLVKVVSRYLKIHYEDPRMRIYLR